MKTVSIIQARMGSSRLRGKIFYKLTGKPILEHIINFLKFSKLNDQIVVATTNESEDDIVEKFCNSLQVACFRGSSENVLSRYYECAKKFDADLIVRITADDPIVIPELVDQIIYPCKNQDYDYSSNIVRLTHPFGICAESFTFKTLERTFHLANDPISKEHVTDFILKNPNLFKIKEIVAPKGLERPNWRLTIDHLEDYNLMTQIFSSLYKENSYIIYSELIKFLDNHLDYLKINAMHNKSSKLL